MSDSGKSYRYLPLDDLQRTDYFPQSGSDSDKPMFRGKNRPSGKLSADLAAGFLSRYRIFGSRENESASPEKV
jgi:hypothetical protein